MNQTVRFFKGKIFMASVFLIPILMGIGRSFIYSKVAKIAEVKNYALEENRDIFNTFDNKEQNDKGFPIDPFDLMNRLKQAGAMDDATPPSEALDEALNAFEYSED